MSAILTITLNPAIDETVELTALHPGQVNRALAAASYPGGKGVNVAGCLADWFAARDENAPPVRACGILGDANDALFSTFFAERGIEDLFLRVSGHTRRNLKLIDHTAEETTDINTPGLPCNDEGAAIIAHISSVSQAGDIAVLAGSVPSAMPHDIYVTLLDMLHRQGLRTVLDTSGAALGAVLNEAKTLPFCLKPNRHELEEWAGTPLCHVTDLLRAGRELTARGVTLAAISLGAEGALFVTDDQAVHVQPPPMQVLNTVGAGDALVAGIVTALHDDLPLEQLARRAVALASAKLTLPGASLPGPDLVLTLESRLIVQTLQDNACHFRNTGHTAGVLPS
ncbi:1-phosphofructokinase family hexose kinase [Granulibacter bethesdensis]|uniref:1-phosphofructokinase family hexose kinase n=1 Tax=Granulibacter bethesdensis TaxID=364410 RepID=UPI0003F2153E|nr:1-phosphofructokinase family hexose kinase [Granulibacter bethesdensis]AHJ67423.1 1-phosphofructokinase [Granulibacter bethesdensis]